MPREKDGYRQKLELLIDAFPNKKMINVSEAAQWTGLNWRTVKKLYFGEKQFICLVDLARKM